MKTLAVVILDKFADWEPALLAAGLQSIIGGYTLRWASVDREVKTSMGRVACGTRYDNSRDSHGCGCGHRHRCGRLMAHPARRRFPAARLNPR